MHTPYYLIDEEKLLKNLEKIQFLRSAAGVKVVLALKCFSTWPVFALMSQYMDGTTSSALYEARLGYEEFGKEVHVYSPAFSLEEIQEVRQYADTIIFNSVDQLQNFYPEVQHLQRRGLRLNPLFSHSDHDLANPARRYSRLGIVDTASVLPVLDRINGVLFHCNCENKDFSKFSEMLDRLAGTYGDILQRLDWVSLGGGIYFTLEDYPLADLAEKLKAFSEQFQIQVYLEPGEAAITRSTNLVSTVLDIVHNEKDIAILDASTEAHMLDLLIYREHAKVREADPQGRYRYILAGKSCLAGDVFGEFSFAAPLEPGQRIHFADAGGYTMVKMNWFNGLHKPSIAVKRLNGSCELVKSFCYHDFKDNFG